MASTPAGLRNTPLTEVVAELARYNETPRLEIHGEALRARSTVFSLLTTGESLIQFLARDADLSVSRNGDVVVINTRQE